MNPVFTQTAIVVHLTHSDAAVLNLRIHSYPLSARNRLPGSIMAAL